MDLFGLTDAPPSDLIAQMGPGGVLTAIGPLGPLGPLGPIGPLGPTTPLITFQGYQADQDGQYMPGLNGCYRPADGEDPHGICRTLLVPWEPQEAPCTAETDNCRRYEMYENYDEGFASTFEDNDTSFMVVGTVAEGDEDTFAFRSHEEQYVTIVLTAEEKPLIDTTALQGLMIAAGYVPNPFFTRSMKYMPEALEQMPGAWAMFYSHETAFDDFDLTVEMLDADGRPTAIAESRSGGHYAMPDWVQVRVPAGARLRARVVLYARRRGIWGNPEAFTLPEAHYRLFVTGSTRHAPALSTTGAHFIPLEGPSVTE